MRCAPVRSASLIPLGYFTRQADPSGIFHGVDAATHTVAHGCTAEGQEEAEFAREFWRFDVQMGHNLMKN
jgi:hypothetical protein